MHVGSFEKRKDLMTLIRAFDLLNIVDLKLILVGSKCFNGSESVYKEIDSFVKRKNLSEKVIMPGHVSKNTLNNFYKNASFYVFPSLDEGFGIPILEASFYNIPTICSDIEVFKEVANDSVLYFKRGNHKDLAKKMELLNYSKEIQQKLISRSRNNLKKFSKKSFIEGFEKIILKS